MNMERVVKAGLAPGAAAAVIFLVISAFFARIDGTKLIEGLVLGLAAAVVSLVIATLVAASKRAHPPEAGRER